MTFLKIISLLFCFIVLVPEVVQAQNSNEFLIYDKTFTFTEEEHGFHTFQPDEGSPANWLSPVNFFDGQMYKRFEIINIPSNTEGLLQICIWQDNNALENCSERPQFAGKGVYTSNDSPSTWWKLDGLPVDFSRPGDFLHIGVVLWDAQGKNVSDWVPSGDSA